MKHNVKNIGGNPTFVHTVGGLVIIEREATITAEFDGNELAAIKGNPALEVSEVKVEQAPEPPRLTKKEQKELDAKREEAASLGVLFDLNDSAAVLQEKIDAKLAE